ncbi:C-C motif chemokine 3-like isoform X1 [Manis javanica]|uniref:C-C motif chemokine 3-like isoform X1 n=1 Tax=Manis javanica TaxID=9974 RepID=UPI003C6D4E46
MLRSDMGEGAFPFSLQTCEKTKAVPNRGETVGANTPTACCFFYVSRKIPRKFVDNYYETSSQCSKPGVIFQTKRGRQICADPGKVWVREYITYLELNA